MCSFVAFTLSERPTETSSDWIPSIYGVWQDDGNAFTGYLPDVDDSVFHFGPTRIWSRPVHSGKYSKYD